MFRLVALVVVCLACCAVIRFIGFIGFMGLTMGWLLPSFCQRPGSSLTFDPCFTLSGSSLLHPHSLQVSPPRFLVGETRPCFVTACGLTFQHLTPRPFCMPPCLALPCLALHPHHDWGFFSFSLLNILRFWRLGTPGPRNLSRSRGRNSSLASVDEEPINSSPMKMWETPSGTLGSIRLACWFGWLIDWLMDYLIDWFVGWLIKMVNLLVHRLMGRLGHW